MAQESPWRGSAHPRKDSALAMASRAARCSRMPVTVTASRSGSVLMVGAADAGLVIKSELATASAQANDKCLRMRNPPRGEMILSGHAAALEVAIRGTVSTGFWLVQRFRECRRVAPRQP